MGWGIGGIGVHGQLKLLTGGPEVLGLVVDDAQAPVAPGILWLKFDGPPEVSHGLIKIAGRRRVPKGAAHRQVQVSVARPELEGSPAGGPSLLKASLSLQHVAPAMIGLGTALSPL